MGAEIGRCRREGTDLAAGGDPGRTAKLANVVLENGKRGIYYKYEYKITQKAESVVITDQPGGIFQLGNMVRVLVTRVNVGNPISKIIFVGQGTGTAR